MRERRERERRERERERVKIVVRYDNELGISSQPVHISNRSHVTNTGTDKRTEETDR